jgi:hypothetical protein
VSEACLVRALTHASPPKKGNLPCPSLFPEKWGLCQFAYRLSPCRAMIGRVCNKRLKRSVHPFRAFDS